MLTRRSFLKLTGASTIGFYVSTTCGWTERAVAAIPGGTLDLEGVPKYATALLIPPVMPRAAKITMPGGKIGDYYEISVRQFKQQILPAKKWMDEITDNPAVNTTEVWEYYNTTADAHPMHIHEVAFQVVNRQGLALDGEGEVVRPVQPTGTPIPPEPWESGRKDTVIAYPGQVTRLRMRFTNPGQFVWHCHIVEHEDNEMMRPYRIGPSQPGQPNG